MAERILSCPCSVRNIRASIEMRNDFINKVPFRNCADNLLRDLSAPEHQHRWDTADAVLHRCARVGVDIHFDHFEFAIIVSGNLIDGWSDHLAWSTPICPKI